MNKKKILAIVGVSVALLCVFVFVIDSNTKTNVYECEVKIENINEGYMFVNGIIKNYGSDMILINYKTGYLASGLNDKSEPIFYGYTFKTIEAGNIIEESETGYYAIIDLKGQVLKVASVSVLDVANAVPTPLEMPGLGKILKVINNESNKLISDLLQKDENTVMWITRSYSYKDMPSFNWWDITFANQDYMSRNYQDIYWSCKYDSDLNEIVETN